MKLLLHKIRYNVLRLWRKFKRKVLKINSESDDIDELLEICRRMF